VTIGHKGGGGGSSRSVGGGGGGAVMRPHNTRGSSAGAGGVCPGAVFGLFACSFGVQLLKLFGFDFFSYSVLF
jgi:hypothetical protein